VDEVGTLHTVQCGFHLPEVEQVAVHDLGPTILELLRPLVLPVGQRPESFAFSSGVG